VLVETGPGGSVFDLTLSGAPEPLPPVIEADLKQP